MAFAHRIPRLGLDRLVVAVMALTAFAVASIPYPDADYWWHLAVGRFLVQQREWPSPDPFSFTASGQVWTVHEWLVEVLMYGLYNAFGHSGPRAFFAACFAAAMVIPFLVLRRAGLRVTVAASLMILLTIGCLQSAGPRPHLISILLFVLTWLFLDRWRAQLDRTIWAMPLIFCVWVNLHAGFLPGLAVPFLVLAGDLVGRVAWREHDALSGQDLRRLVASLLLSIGALFCSPSGWRIPVYPFTALGRTDVQAILEWMPTNIRAWSTWPFFALVAIYLLLVIIRRPRLPATELLTAGLFIAGGLWVVRVLPFSCIAVTFLIARMLPLPHESLIRWPSVTRSSSRAVAPARDLPRWAEAIALLPLVAAGLAVASYYNNGYGSVGQSLAPAKAAAALGSEGLPTPLLNQYNFGGYLVWHFAPEQKVFIDGRSHDLYTHGSLFSDYLVMEEVRPGTDALIEHYGIQTVIYPKDALLPRYLLATGAWVTTYEDESAVVLRRSSPPTPRP